MPSNPRKTHSIRSARRSVHHITFLLLLLLTSDKAFTLEEDRVNAGVNGPALVTQAKPVAENIVKQTNAFANFVMKQIKASNDSQHPHVIARIEADERDEACSKRIPQLSPPRPPRVDP